MLSYGQQRRSHSGIGYRVRDSLYQTAFTAAALTASFRNAAKTRKRHHLERRHHMLAHESRPVNPWRFMKLRLLVTAIWLVPALLYLLIARIVQSMGR